MRCNGVIQFIHLAVIWRFVYVQSTHSNEEVPANPDSPLSAKRRVLSQSALRSHRPVARPVSVGLPR